MMRANGEARTKGDDLREKILATALDLFSTHGYFNTSIQDIRRKADVSTGAIYHHFQNKEALAKSLYESLLRQMEDAIVQECQQCSGCFNQSRAIIDRLFRLTVEQPKVMQFVLLAQHREYLPGEPPICSSRPFQIMRQVIEQGMAAGEVRQMELWVAATTMFGGALRMMNLYLDEVLEYPLPDYTDEVANAAWRGICP
ncbi:TetR/AcrR family transcriptional regulator [Thiothrix nivea]|nr:TetR/AcrR family transcriptional regulator [Thiothrix nivea]